jgi:hypothetical protein
MSDLGFERAVNEWLDDGSDRTPQRAIDGVLLAVKTTPQERDLRIPWRFPRMTALTRATSIAAVALVAVVGAGGLYLVGTGSTTPPRPTDTAPSSTPVSSPDPTPIHAGWTTYTSGVHGFSLKFPAGWSVLAPAGRDWRPGDTYPDEPWPYADVFVSPEAGDAQMGLLVWEMPSDGAELDSFDEFKTWAEQFCAEVALGSCETFADGAVAISRPDALGNSQCGPAILVPTANAQYAFFRGCGDALLGVDEVRVTVIGREDGFPGAAQYGGTVRLLEAIVSTMSGWEP